MGRKGRESFQVYKEEAVRAQFSDLPEGGAKDFVVYCDASHKDAQIEAQEGIEERKEEETTSNIVNEKCRPGVGYLALWET
ncbi:hypothetical protein Tco_0005509 [Tanacetum coccineum]